MGEYKLSNYFNKNPIKFNNELHSYIIHEKKIRIKQDINDTNRSICQMVRDINVNTNSNYENILCSILYYTEEAVKTLIEYKDNWIQFLKIDSKNNISKGRSTFNSNKRLEALNYIEIDHEIFKLYKNLYYNISDKNNKELILECIYYTYKINEKLIFYENLNIK